MGRQAITIKRPDTNNVTALLLRYTQGDNMNLYGIPTAIQAYFRVWQETSRNTGRTSKMLDDLSNGDCVIVPSANHINYIQSMARKKGLNIRVEVVNPSMLDISNLRALKGQIVFDHAFVEQYFDNELLSSERRLKELSEYLTETGLQYEHKYLPKKSVPKKY